MPSSPLHAPVLDWYSSCARSLPWRDPDVTPWGVLVSEVMLQQTPVARVRPVWEEWWQRWPRPPDLAAAAPADAIRAWGRLGYPRRALRLHAAARLITERHGGTVPDDVPALRALPGVGAYTASAVACFGFGRRHPVVDTNVRRVQARAVHGRAAAAPSLTAGEVRTAAGLLPDDAPVAARWSVAVMELGALVCTARSPRCEACPVAAQCAWRVAGRPPAGGGARRRQRWAGTDRQVRGRVLALLRATEEPLPEAAVHAVWPDPGQRERCLGSLLADGLVERAPGGGYRLPVRR